ncbi:keratinocyte-associated protein 3 isoform X1 [Sorex araneus]|uniref:keratinocyte-associated protein 3 isoform X1 n=1 Tax=Sorex araneus TaxID=42254 RepID=UPI002433E858|nr:keratinocyte-associated protein 3 isoform X1 [Sorex araneus]XP_054975835.1 keratinocyte-associated protein 3 isoform X1 [Sorex araneus]
MRCCRLCTFDAARGPRRLMRVGLALILVGHMNLLLGAVLHGTVLRHVANPRGAVTSEYTAANVISVGSGLLSVSVGLVALLASRNLFHWQLVRLFPVPSRGLGAGRDAGRWASSFSGEAGPPGESWALDRVVSGHVGHLQAIHPDLSRQHWALLGVALANLLLSAACSLGLLIAVCLTVANGGRRLIADCHPGPMNLLRLDCPFDPTRIYHTALALWIPSLLMSVAEADLSAYCCVAALTLRGVGPFRQEELQAQLEELTELELPKQRRQENEQLLDQNQEIQSPQKNWV